MQNLIEALSAKEFEVLESQTWIMLNKYEKRYGIYELGFGKNNWLLALADGEKYVTEEEEGKIQWKKL